MKKVSLRCADGNENCVLKKFVFSLTEGCSFEFTIEDDYIGGDYKGFFGRLKRAWRAFWAKPVVYTSVYCEDKEKMKKFLTDCLILVDGCNHSDWHYIEPIGHGKWICHKCGYVHEEPLESVTTALKNLENFNNSVDKFMEDLE